MRFNWDFDKDLVAFGRTRAGKLLVRYIGLFVAGIAVISILAA
jgi:hypothetical protein